jgi:hypothetical protein
LHTLVSLAGSCLDYKLDPILIMVRVQSCSVVQKRRHHPIRSNPKEKQDGEL